MAQGNNNSKSVEKSLSSEDGGELSSFFSDEASSNKNEKNGIVEEHSKSERMEQPSAPKKNDYASVYQEKQAKKNPGGYTSNQVLNMIKNGTIVAGPPPAERNCKSAAWANGIHFLFTKKTANDPQKEVLNWYYCSKCDWIYNGLLTMGTGAVTGHYKKHLQDPPYIFNRDQLAKLLSAATAIGKANGTVSESVLIKILPKGDKWSEEFWLNIDQNDSNQAVLEDAEKKSNAPESDVIAESSAKNVSKRGRKEMEVDDTIANRGKNEPRSENNSTTKRSKKSVEGNIAIKRLSKVMEKKDHVNKTAAKPVTAGKAIDKEVTGKQAEQHDEQDVIISTENGNNSPRKFNKNKKKTLVESPGISSKKIKKKLSSGMPMSERIRLLELLKPENRTKIDSKNANTLHKAIVSNGNVPTQPSGSATVGNDKRLARKFDGIKEVSTPIRKYRSKLRKRFDKT